MNYLYVPGYSFIISLIMNIVFFSKKRLNTTETKVFKYMLISSLIDSFLGVIIIGLGISGNYTIQLINVLNKIDFIMYLIWIIGFFIYNLHLLNLKDKYFELIKKLSVILGIIFCILIIITSINSVNENGVMYVDGLSSNILYLSILLYFIFIISMLIVNIKNLFNKKYIPMAVLVLIISLGLFLRNYDPTLLITSSILAITNLIMYFTILNPDINMLEEIGRNRELIERNNEEKSNLMFKISCDLKSPIRNLISLSDCLLKNENEKNETYLKKLNNELKQLLFLLNYEFDTNITYDKIIENSYNIKLVFNEIVTIIKNNNKDILFNYEIRNTPNYLYGDNLKIKEILISIINSTINNQDIKSIELNLDSIIKYDFCRLIFTINVSNHEIKLREINDIMYGDNNLYNSDLVNVKNMIENLGGAFYLNSSDGKTTFKVVFDQVICKDDNDLLVDEIEKNLKTLNNQKKILIVDDNYDEAMKIRNYLKKNNYLVVTCLTYFDFEKKANEYKYDFVLLDDEFDGKTALELSDKINKSKIIVMLSKDKSLIKQKYLKNKKYKDIILKENLIAEIKRVID